ncbi:hypothetical protein GCM10008090_03540 [Arenicella chitinivorans]|uniref:Tetratricopeptide repeat protein n=1 Tax=Arenicella chitinivorans TaxID=1329800 RepID=A0A918RII7_9GAMM|nr:tetratricopeptide repeat protein [Arenicella chitinivorans]GGZ98383.1 hypothetical protein GCM10008090_03540 [Arenicella chitinivorans]
MYNRKSGFGVVIIVVLSLLSACVTPPTGSQLRPPTATGLPGQLDLKAKFEKANIAYQEGRLVEAERWFLNIVMAHPTLADAWFKLGNIYYRSGRLAAAVNAYEEVLKIDNKFEQAWFNLALTRVSQSVEVIDQSLSFIEPDSPYFDQALALKARLINKVNEGQSDKKEAPSNSQVHVVGEVNE